MILFIFIYLYKLINYLRIFDSNLNKYVRITKINYIRYFLKEKNYKLNQ